MCYLLNHIACTALDGKIPLLALTGITPDTSIILLFTFYQPVFYATYDQHFPSESEERAGCWVGFGEHCGDAMTHKILDQNTQKIIYRSAVRPKKSSTPNHRLAPHGGEVSTSSDPSEDKISSGSPLGSPEGYSPKQKAPTVLSGPEMKRIHLDPSLCLHLTLVTLIQFPPEMDENWVRYGLAKLGQISRLPNWQRMLFCAYTTQLLHSTGEVCWNNKDSYFIWFEFVC